MAFGDGHQHDQHDLEHCPPIVSGDSLSIVEHPSDSAVMFAEPCNITGGQCAFLEDYNYDGRTVEVKVKHAPSDVPLGVTPSNATTPLHGALLVAQDATDPPGRSASRPPLNLLFCIYQI